MGLRGAGITLSPACEERGVLVGMSSWYARTQLFFPLYITKWKRAQVPARTCAVTGRLALQMTRPVCVRPFCPAQFRALGRGTERGFVWGQTLWTEREAKLGKDLGGHLLTVC